MYIQAPSEQQPIIVSKGNAPKVKPAKWEEVPESYRKVKLTTKLRPYASEILLRFLGFAEFIRKGISYEVK